MDEKFYIICLASRPDRREVIMREFEHHGLLDQIDLINAVTPDSQQVRYLGGNLNLDWIRYGSPLRNELACLASHLIGLRQIIADGKPGFVIEDDIILHKEFVERWKKVKAKINSRHELIYVSCTADSPKDVQSYDETKIITRHGIVWGTGGYWVTPDRARRMIETYGKPMTEYGLRTSECISLLGPNHQVFPLLLIEDPTSFSSMRPEQFANNNLTCFATWGLENYGGAYRDESVEKLPFILLLSRFRKNPEDPEVQKALTPYLAQPRFLTIKCRFD